MKHIILASTSTIHGDTYLNYLSETLKVHFKNTETLLFIPYAQPGGISYDEYTSVARKFFSKININVKGIHEFENPKEAVTNAEGIFVGGGNTFVLVNKLYQLKLMALLSGVIKDGTPYLGTSAGSNICGLTMQTSNDMPIIYPPSFKTLGVVPFNINPHYLDPDTTSKHMGETRETRIKEFHSINTQPVIGLREGSWLEIYGDIIALKGKLEARIFEQSQSPYEVKPNSNLSDLK